MASLGKSKLEKIEDFILNMMDSFVIDAQGGSIDVGRIWSNTANIKLTLAFQAGIEPKIEQDKDFMEKLNFLNSQAQAAIEGRYKGKLTNLSTEIAGLSRLINKYRQIRSPDEEAKRKEERIAEAITFKKPTVPTVITNVSLKNLSDAVTQLLNNVSQIGVEETKTVIDRMTTIYETLKKGLVESNLTSVDKADIQTHLDAFAVVLKQHTFPNLSDMKDKPRMIDKFQKSFKTHLENIESLINKNIRTPLTRQ